MSDKDPGKDVFETALLSKRRTLSSDESRNMVLGTIAGTVLGARKAAKLAQKGDKVMAGLIGGWVGSAVGGTGAALYNDSQRGKRKKN